MPTVTAISEVSNDAKSVIEADIPYQVQFKLEGVAPFLFHRWSVDGVEAKSKAAKGSKAKKEDDVETYVYRNDDGELCIPAEYLRMAMVHAAKYEVRRAKAMVRYGEAWRGEVSSGMVGCGPVRCG